MASSSIPALLTAIPISWACVDMVVEALERPECLATTSSSSTSTCGWPQRSPFVDMAVYDEGKAMSIWRDKKPHWRSSAGSQ